MTSASLTLASRPISWRLVLLVFLPFAAGYYLTYLFRTINALIASRLMADLGLGAADLGVLTSGDLDLSREPRAGGRDCHFPDG